MTYAAVAGILLYYCIFIIYFRRLFPGEKAGLIPVGITLALIAMSYLYLNHYSLPWLRIPVFFIIMTAGLRFSTGMNAMQSLCSGGISVLSAYSFRGAFSASSAFIFRGHDFLLDANAYYTVAMIALPLGLLFFVVIRRSILPDEKLKRFLKSGHPLRLVVVYEVAASINLMILNSGRFLPMHNVWFLQIALGTCVLTMSMLIYIIYQSTHSIELLEYQIRSRMLEEQYERQLRHYKSYQKYTESFRAFKHDYKAMMASLKSLIRSGETDAAIQLIDDIYGDMQKKVRVHKKYSNHVVLDAMLQDLANICAEEEIRFSFHVITPRNTGLSLLDSIRIFSNLTNNAVEACRKLPLPERFLTITTSIDEQWVSLEVINSFDGELKLKNGVYVTTKASKESHGFGLNIVREITEGLGGYLLCAPNLRSKTFLVRVHLPQTGKSEIADIGSNML